MKHLKFLYYKYYQFQVRMGNADVASFSSILIISFILMLYYFDFFIILSVLFPKKSIDLSWEFNLILLLFVIMLLYILLVHKGKYKKILREQEKVNLRKESGFLFYFRYWHLFYSTWVLHLKSLRIKENFKKADC